MRYNFLVGYTIISKFGGKITYDLLQNWFFKSWQLYFSKGFNSKNIFFVFHFFVCFPKFCKHDLFVTPLQNKLILRKFTFKMILHDVNNNAQQMISNVLAEGAVEKIIWFFIATKASV